MSDGNRNGLDFLAILMSASYLANLQTPEACMIPPSPLLFLPLSLFSPMRQNSGRGGTDRPTDRSLSINFGKSKSKEEEGRRGSSPLPTLRRTALIMQTFFSPPSFLPLSSGVRCCQIRHRPPPFPLFSPFLAPPISSVLYICG